MLECILSAAIFKVVCIGLHRHQGQHRFHTIQKRYEVFVNAVSNFAIIQFGICTFHWSSTANRYFAKPFNFYVFPRGTRGRKEINRCFGVQSGAFDFLTTCGFDFNKVQSV
jgi:poly(A)-specific ribonuclease